MVNSKRQRSHASQDSLIDYINETAVRVVNNMLKEGRYYNPRTYQREEQYELSNEEIKQLVRILKDNPIEEKWEPVDLGFCKVQRVDASDMNGTRYILGDPHTSDVTCTDGTNGDIYIQMGRPRNTHWLDEVGYTYIAWKD